MPRRKKKKESPFNKKNMLGLFIVTIMVLSGLGYMMNSDEGPANYNGRRFMQSGNFWVTNIDGRDVAFSYHPADLEDIDAGASVDFLLQSQMAFITFDPGSEIVPEVEVARMNLEQDLFRAGVYPVSGITSNNTLYSQFPIVTCLNATQLVPVISFEQSNETGIEMQGYCIKVKAIDGYDVTPLKERLEYGLYGII